MVEPVATREAMTREQLEALGEEIATFAARIDVAEHALLTRLRTFDAHDAWGNTGFLSCAQWLSWRIGIGPKAARERVRVARALGSLPKTDALFGRGELSYSKVRAITRVATPETEEELIELALRATAAQVEKLIRTFERCATLADASRELPPSQRRLVRRSETPGGMVRIEMQLPPEEAAVVWEAMMSAIDQREDEPESEASAGASDLETRDPESEASAGASAPDGDELEQRRADAIVDVARAYLQHRPRTLSSGYELVLITSKEQLEHGRGGVGGFLRDGTPVPLEAARMLASDSARVDVVVGEQGEILDVGRRTRAIPSAILRALWLRDGGCRVPGCGRKRHLHGHHVQGWAKGGATSLSNLVLVCSSHHRLIHEGVLSTEVRDEKIAFIDQQGRELPQTPPPTASGEELEALERFLDETEISIDPDINMPMWDGRRMDLAMAVDWMFHLFS